MCVFISHFKHNKELRLMPIIWKTRDFLKTYKNILSSFLDEKYNFI